MAKNIKAGDVFVVNDSGEEFFVMKQMWSNSQAQLLEAWAEDDEGNIRIVKAWFGDHQITKIRLNKKLRAISARYKKIRDDAQVNKPATTINDYFVGSEATIPKQ